MNSERDVEWAVVGISKNPSEGGDKRHDKLVEFCVNLQNTFEVNFFRTFFSLDQYLLLRDSTPPIP